MFYIYYFLIRIFSFQVCKTELLTSQTRKPAADSYQWKVRVTVTLAAPTLPSFVAESYSAGQC